MCYIGEWRGGLGQHYVTDIKCVKVQYLVLRGGGGQKDDKLCYVINYAI